MKIITYNTATPIYRYLQNVTKKGRHDLAIYEDANIFAP